MKYYFRFPDDRTIIYWQNTSKKQRMEDHTYSHSAQKTFETGFRGFEKKEVSAIFRRSSEELTRP